MLRAATVTSMEKFTRVSGQRLAEGLIGELNRPPNACWLFCAPQNGIEELLAGIYDVLRIETIIGCTTDGDRCVNGCASLRRIKVSVRG